MTEALNQEIPGDAPEDEPALESRSASDNGMAQGELDRMDVIRRFENGMYPYADRIKKATMQRVKEAPSNASWNT